jgi:hypothetical protein
MFTAESIKLLAKDARRHTGRTQLHFVEQDDGRDGVKVSDPTDPDDAIDPDDLIATEPVQCPLLLPPPVKPETWWSALVFGSDNADVSPQDASLALAHVAYRLGYARFDVGLSHNDMTVEGLHTIIEERYGGPGWTALMECWHAVAGIKQPEHKFTQTDIPVRIPETSRTSLPSFSSSTESEAEALRQLPLAIARFWLKEPHVPAWRYSETADEQELRERMEADGSWCG